MKARKALCLVLTLSTFTAVLPAAPAAADPTPCVDTDAVPVPAKGSGIRVEQICRDALSLQQLDNVRLINVDQSERVAAISLLDPLRDGEGVVVPEASALDIVSDHGNRMHAANGIRTTIRQYAANGESYGLDGTGTASFNILNALDFWNVFVTKRFIAAVHGTLFSVDLSDPQSVTFTVTRGTVTITRFVEARILSTGEVIDGLRTNVKISPDTTPSVTYPRAPEIYRSFKDRVDARMLLSEDLQRAQQSKDLDDIEDATDNLLRLNTVTAPEAGNAAVQASVPLVFQAAGAGIAALLIDVFVLNKPHRTPAPVRASEPGNLGVSSLTR